MGFFICINGTRYNLSFVIMLISVDKIKEKKFCEMIFTPIFVKQNQKPKTMTTKESNKVVCEIQETFMKDFIILVYNNDLGIFIKAFAKNKRQAKKVADKLFDYVTNQF